MRLVHFLLPILSIIQESGMFFDSAVYIGGPLSGVSATDFSEGKANGKLK